MIKFLIYVFESGICLSLFFLIYLLFLRKETYFAFNRIYLIASLVLSLILPFVHLDINFDESSKSYSYINELQEFRSYYEQIIAMTDPEFYFTEKSNKTPFFEDFAKAENANTLKSSAINNQFHNETVAPQKLNLLKSKVLNPVKIIFGIYIAGMLFFLIRLIFLLVWIYKTIKQNPLIRKEGFYIVDIQEEMPPFSFFNFVFINRKILSPNDYNQILAHEKVHVWQMHSLDLFFAQIIAVFLWFNPLVWLFHKALKTIHDYLADKTVFHQGYKLFDYQSLLLSQLISIRSVELVNNFNLVSIKKRIEMMNKIKSGTIAKLKALVIIPVAIALFVFFADMTVKGTDTSSTIHNYLEQTNKELDGLWKNSSNEDNGKLISFKQGKMSVLNKESDVKVYDFSADAKQIHLYQGFNVTIDLKYLLKNDVLTIWWNNSMKSQYRKTKFDNSLDMLVAKQDVKVDLPIINYFRILEKSHLCLNVFVDENRVQLGSKTGSIDDLEKLLKQEKEKISLLDLSQITVCLHVDKNVSMRSFHKIKQVLRRNDMLKMALIGKCDSDKVSELMSHAVGIPKRLPPSNVEEIDFEEVKENRLNLIVLKPSENKKMSVAEADFKKQIIDSKKYLMLLEYDNQTTYEQYVAYTDMVYSVIFELRNEQAQKVYFMNYDDLSIEQQKVIRSKYPISLTEKSSDLD